MKVIHYKAGVPSVVEIERPTLPHLQKMVGGLIELVRLPNGIDLWCNEEGNLIGLPVYVYPWCPILIAGDIVLARSNKRGETSGLTEEDIQNLLH